MKRVLLLPAWILLNWGGLRTLIRLHLLLLLCILFSLLLPLNLSDSWLSTMQILLALTLVYLSVTALLQLQDEIGLLSRLCEQQMQQRDHRELTLMTSGLNPLRQVIGRLLNQFQRQDTQLRQSLEEIAHATQELEQSADQVAANAEHQSLAAATAASAVEQLNASIREVATLAEESRLASDQAGFQVEAGNRCLQDLVTRINTMAHNANDTHTLIGKLGEHSLMINQMSSVISEIADQTNLLALNAAIEAARAGEAGRGFAVVADEVRNLAQRSQRSAIEITQSIDSVQHYIQQVTEHMGHLSQLTEAGVSSADEVSNALLQIDRQSQQVVHQVTQVAISTEQQNLAATEISTLAEQVRLGNVENNRVAEQTKAIAQHLARLTAGATGSELQR